MNPKDFVQWDRANAKYKGQIVSLHGDAAQVARYVKNDDGTWTPTGHVTALQLTALKALVSIDADPEVGTKAMPVRHRSPKPGSKEHRVVKLSVLETRDATTGVNAQAWLLVNDYTLTDTYGTRFALGGAAAYLKAHDNRPTLLFGHGSQGGISSVLGHAVAWRENAQGLEVCFEFDNFDDVPSARQAFAQLKSRSLDSFSIGFIRHADHYVEDGDYTSIDEYDLPEVSIVIEASNGGTKVLQLSGARMTQEQRGVQILMDLDAGTLTLADAIVDMRNLLIEVRDPADGDGGSDKAKVDCPTCDGSGKINEGTTKCPDCDGSGKVLEERADELNGVAAEDRAAVIEYRGKYSDAEKAQMLKDGDAMPNAKGEASYPIKDADDVQKAVKMVGLGNKAGPTIRKWIMKQAAKYGLTKNIPDTWNNDGTVGGRSIDPETEALLAEIDG
jgi:HK97 family phage prohead protease